MPPISKPEVRFKENSGERFLENGKVRCHGLAKSKMRQWRETYQDTETPSEELWPECQCGQAAEEGQYVCRFHGGKTPRTKNPPRTILDVMPLDLADKFRAIMDSPDYISRKDDINLIRARVMMLVDELNEEAGSEETWAHVHEALVKLRQGDTLNAIDYLERALKANDHHKEVWKEIYQTEKLLGDLTTTQMKTAKELQSIATLEQVHALIATLVNVVLSGISDYIPDPMLRTDYTRMIVSEVQKLTRTTPAEMILDAK